MQLTTENSDVTILALASLDGFIARKDGSVDRLECGSVTLPELGDAS